MRAADRPTLRAQVVMTALAAAVLVATHLGGDPADVALVVGAGVLGGAVGRRLNDLVGGILAAVIAIVASGVDAEPDLLAFGVATTVAAGAIAFAAARVIAMTASALVPVALVGIGLRWDVDVPVIAVVAAGVIGLGGLVLFATDGGAAGRVATDVRERSRAAGVLLLVLVPIVVLAAALLPQTDRRGADGLGTGDADRFEPFSYPGFGDELDITEPVELGDEVILRVDADERTFWRAGTFDRFDGRRWTRGDVAPDPDPGVDPALPSASFEQTFTAERVVVGALPSASVPREVSGDLLAFGFAEDGTVVSPDPLLPGATYTVESTRPLVGAEALRAATGPIPDAVRSAHTTPGQVTDRVAQAAREVTAGLTNDYDRVRALEAWIGSQVEYRRDIPPLPLGSDAVDHFLFESRIGFCEQVGTSLVVMARSLGIPARLVVGFVPADRESGQWVVRAEHAHAWAEVWFPGIGWQGFDPTASVPLAADDEPPDDGSLLPMVLVLVGAAILLAGVAWWLRRRRGDTEGPAPDRWATTAGERLVEAGRVAGVDVEPPRTIREIGDGLVEAGSETSVADLAVTLDRAAFGATPITDAERSTAEDGLARLELWAAERAGQDEQDSIEQPALVRAQSGRRSAKRSRPG